MLSNCGILKQKISKRNWPFGKIRETDKGIQNKRKRQNTDILWYYFAQFQGLQKIALVITFAVSARKEHTMIPRKKKLFIFQAAVVQKVDSAITQYLPKYLSSG